MTLNLPLAGLNIVVTRPREQAVELAHRIDQAGGKVILFPLLEISPISDSQPLQAVLKRLGELNLAIFMSPNAVRYGMEAVHAAGGMPPTLKIATVGQGSAKALASLGIGNVIAPQDRFDSEALLALPELQNGVLRKEAGTMLPPAERAEYDRELNATRTQLDAAAFDAAWQAGQAMTIDQAMELAVSETVDRY